jgi:hypothetical protein
LFLRPNIVITCLAPVPGTQKYPPKATIIIGKKKPGKFVDLKAKVKYL